jgi:hypothetical protein
MRRILAGLACAGLMTSTPAQVITGAMFMPSPVGLIVSAGQWIYNGIERVYYIEVLGEGTTVEQARNNGFRLAVEQAVGTIIASETEVNNGRLTRDEIISYASAYVYRYEIVKQESGGLGVKTTMKVWLKSSAVANRLLSESSSPGTVDGATAAVNINSIVRERQDGDRLLATVLNDFPRRAFDVKIGKTQVTFDGNRQSRLEVPITVNFSSHYLDSLWAALSATENKNGNGSAITVKTSGLFGGGTAYYTDTYKYYQVKNQMISLNLLVKVSLLNDQNQVVYSEKYDFPALTHSRTWPGDPVLVDPAYRGNSQTAYQLLVDGRRALSVTVQIPATPAILQQISRVNVEIVR